MLSNIKQYLKRIPPIKAYLRCQYRNRAEHEFWKWTEHDEVSYRFYQQFIKPGDMVFDVGANRGNRAKLFVKLKARVVMVEPQPNCAEYLRMVFRHIDEWVLIEGALGSAEGEEEMLISPVDVLSTFSRDWVQTVKESGRFDDVIWDKRQKVRMTTLDSLIRQYGAPSFIKIDVEGYELEVISGLSIPPASISFEFTPEFAANTFRCIDRLSSLADFEFQVSLDESMIMAFPQWLPATELKEHLSKIKADSDTTVFGDVYARKK